MVGLLVAAIIPTSLTAGGGERTALPIAIAKFDPATLPNIKIRPRELPHATMTKLLEEKLRGGECKIIGQSNVKYDLAIPYAIQFGQNGEAMKIVVTDVGCRSIEMAVGEVVASQVGRGDYQPEPDVEQWFTAELHFSNVNRPKQSVAKDPTKVACRSTTKVGSRLQRNRVCKTLAEWEAYDAAVRATGRDIGNSAACLGNANCHSE